MWINSLRVHKWPWKVLPFERSSSGDRCSEFRWRYVVFFEMLAPEWYFGSWNDLSVSPLPIALFDRSHTASYWSSIGYMSLVSCTVSKLTLNCLYIVSVYNRPMYVRVGLHQTIFLNNTSGEISRYDLDISNVNNNFRSLHCALAAAQCIVVGPVCGYVYMRLCVCTVYVCVLGVCYHDNSKFRASILTKLGLWAVTISSWLNFGSPAPPRRECAAGRNFFGPALLYSQRAVFASPLSAFSL